MAPWNNWTTPFIHQPCLHVQYSSESLVAEVFAQPSPDRHAFPPALVAQGVIRHTPRSFSLLKMDPLRPIEG
jgi:hypothetical protein